jgi:type VI protein secretion system component Hcp
MAGFDIFLKLDGISGDSTAKGHKKEIKVFSYDQSIDSTVPSAGGSGGGAGKSTFSGVRGWDVKANRKL